MPLPVHARVFCGARDHCSLQSSLSCASWQTRFNHNPDTRSAIYAGGGWQRIGGAVAFSIPIVGTLYLGTWQAKRYNWKVKMIEENQKSLASDPVPLPADGNWGLMGTRRVMVEGIFDTKRTMFVGPRSQPARYVHVHACLLALRCGHTLHSHSRVPQI